MGGGGEGVDGAGWVDPGDPWPTGCIIIIIVIVIVIKIIKIIILGTTDRLHWDYNPLGWLKAKAVDDDCENLWRVHNGLYDLSQWVNKHPGR